MNNVAVRAFGIRISGFLRISDLGFRIFHWPPRNACPVQVPSYNAPMLDIKLIREKPDLVRERLSARGGGDESKVNELLALDEQRRKLLTESEQLKSLRNRVSKEIGALMGQKKLDEAESKKKETQDLGARIKDLDQKVMGVETARNEILIRLPNLQHASGHVGKRIADSAE